VIVSDREIGYSDWSPRVLISRQQGTLFQFWRWRQYVSSKRCTLRGVTTQNIVSSPPWVHQISQLRVLLWLYRNNLKSRILTEVLFYSYIWVEFQVLPWNRPQQLFAHPFRSVIHSPTVICSELSSGVYCRVKWLSTDVSEVRTASIISQSTIILHGSTSQKTILNIILAAVRTWNLIHNHITYLTQIHAAKKASWNKIINSYHFRQ
jgi:hypothetical protein